MTERIIVMRHLQDVDDLSFKNDSPLLENETARVKIIAQEVSRRAIDLGVRQVSMVTSSKTRAMSTTCAVANHVSQRVSTYFRVDNRIREIDQGKYQLPHGYQPGDNFQPLRDAWSVFFNETFVENNLRYRFGDPVKHPDSSVKHPEIEGYFLEYGENQIEFSIRFYSFLSYFCKEFHNKPDILPLVVTHQSLVARIAETEHIMDQIKNGSMTRPELGTLPLLEWDAFQQLNNQEEMLVEFGGITSSDLSTVTEFTDILDSEVAHLKSLL